MHLHTHTSSARRGSMLLRQHAGRPPTARAAPAARPRQHAGPTSHGNGTSGRAQCRAVASTRTHHSTRSRPAYGPTAAPGQPPSAPRGGPHPASRCLPGLRIGAARRNAAQEHARARSTLHGTNLPMVQQRPSAGARGPSAHGPPPTAPAHPPPHASWASVGGSEKFREKFRETSSTPPPSAHNRPQADLILVLGRDLVREDFQSVPELTVHFCIGRCTLALPAFPAGPDSLYCRRRL